MLLTKDDNPSIYKRITNLMDHSEVLYILLSQQTHVCISRRDRQRARISVLL